MKADRPNNPNVAILLSFVLSLSLFFYPGCSSDKHVLPPPDFPVSTGDSAMITVQPAGQTVYAGLCVTLAVTAKGDPAPSYANSHEIERKK